MIGLSPLSSGHPPGFQPRWVRPSTGSYPRFSLPKDSSPGFASPSQLQELLRLLGGARFQVLFHSPLGVLFTFPSRYWFAIGRRRVFSLGGWSPRIRPGFHVAGPTREGGAGPTREGGRAVGVASPTGLSPCAAGLPRPFGCDSDLSPHPGSQAPGRLPPQPRQASALKL